MIEFKDGKKIQVSKIDDFGTQGLQLVCVSNSPFTKEAKVVAGFNLTEIHCYYEDGAVEISEVVYDSGVNVGFNSTLSLLTEQAQA